MKLRDLPQSLDWLSALRSDLGVRDWLYVVSSNDFYTRLDTARLRWEVRKLYGRVATNPKDEFHFNRGADYAASLLGYDPAELAALPKSSTDSFAGVGNPHMIDPLRPGEVVLDVGSGAGTDLLLAARRVGMSGRAFGIDLTPHMVRRARSSIEECQLPNAQIWLGDAQSLPAPDASMDAVISNGALNLVPDKEQAFREIYRVLRPGGRLMLGDLTLSRRVGRFLRCSVQLWTLCVGGALREDELVSLAKRVGLTSARVTHRFDCIAGTSDEEMARWLGVHGVNLHAVKPA